MKRSRLPDALLALSTPLIVPAIAHAADPVTLPVPCFAGVCGANIPSFVSSGQASAATSGNTLTVTQFTDSAILNWKSFDVSEDGQVIFNQPGANSVALNRIFQADPSRIFGSITANGRIYLINQNGILFGGKSQVNVGGLVASSLDITQKAIDNGIARAAQDGSAAFALFKDGAGTLESGAVEVQAGAKITTANGGQVLLLGPDKVAGNPDAPGVSNAGTITTPGGQAVLAAGNSIYIIPSADPKLRGLVVEVGAGGTATNTGTISAERGNVSIIGLAVNQLGRVSATTSVSENGSIRLLARDSTLVTPDGTNTQLTPQRTGKLEIGAGSVTEVTLSNDGAKTVDVNKQERSSIEMLGNSVHLGKNASIAAKGGDVSIAARSNLVAANAQPVADSTSRLYIEDGVSIDVSGASVDRTMESNVIKAELRGNELRNSPLQRDGALRSETVYFDARRYGVNPDGTKWAGTPIGDVSGQIAGVERDVYERNLIGGTIKLESQSEAVVSSGARFDMSGGSIRYADGFINTSKLIRDDGVLVDIGDASPDRIYTGIASATTYTWDKWDVTESFAGFVGATTFGSHERGYVEGKDAGSMAILSPKMIFDGQVIANRIVGANQRLPSTALSTDPNAPLYRPWNEVPLGGQLDIGARNPFVVSDGERASFYAPSIVLDSQPLLSKLRADGWDPLEDPWLEDQTSVSLSPQMLASSGITRLGLFSNDTVHIKGGQSLVLPAGGALTIAARNIEVAGNIDVPSGHIDLSVRPTVFNDAERAPSLLVKSGASITARGAWINDNPLLDGAGTAPLWIDGGSVSISGARADVTMEKGSFIDVSAGAQRTPNGRLTFGVGGDISLSAGDIKEDGTFGQLTVGSELRSFAFVEGGTLSLSAPGICIGDGDCAKRTEEGPEQYLTLGANLFSQGGFSNYVVKSTQFDARITSGTTLDLRASNWDFTVDISLLPTGTDLRSVVTTSVLPPERRRAVDFSLASGALRAPDGRGLDVDNYDQTGKLVMEQGSLINADPLAHINLASTTSLFVDGIISAPGGSVSLTTSAAASIADMFIPSQGIWLGAQSRINVAGVSLIRPDSNGRRFGDVLDGGSVLIDAVRGYVVAQQGSMIDVSGTTGTVDVRTGAGSQSPYAAKDLASAGGSISILAAEGLFLNGDFDAHSGAPGKVAAGSLSLKIDVDGETTNRRGEPQPIGGDGTSINTFPLGARTITLSQHLSPVALEQGEDIPLALNGQGYISVDQIERSGADSISLSARNISRIDSSDSLSLGTIQLAGDLSLSVGRRLVLEASSIVGDGGKVSLSAPYLAIGSTNRRRREVEDLSTSATTGSLLLDAQLLDVVGHSTISGFADATLHVDGDLRLRGTQGDGARLVDGSLTSNAQRLTLEAQQIYPTTLSQFQVALSGDLGNTLHIGSTGAPSAAVLSAAGSLTLKADRVEQAGTLRAPFGSIVIQAPDVELLAGSVTSTSAAGALIPFGMTQGGLNWAYTLVGQTLVYGKDALPVPEQRISLEGETVHLDSGAVLDVSGGGDLVAQEYFPGVTGTNDILNATLNPNTFAIVPTLGSAYAPYDPQNYIGSSLRPGDSLYLEAGSGLPAGNYALLPARYATLPGAYLVTATTGHPDLAAGESLGQLAGGSIVSGHFTFGDGSLASSRTQGFYVRPGENAQQSARYDVTAASKFFKDQEGLSAATRLPQDSGVVSILASSELRLQGQLKAAAGKGGRGGALEISADNLALTASGAEANVPDGYLAVSAREISALGAQTVVLGGSVGTQGEKSVVTAHSNNILFGEGAELTAPEILALAHESIVVESGARITGSGAATGSAIGAEKVEVADKDAFLRVTSLDQVSVTRGSQQAAQAGNLDVRAGATVASTGSVLFDSAGDMMMNGAIDAIGASVYFGASQISLGTTPPQTAGLTLNEQQLAGLSQSDLVFASRGSVDLFGDLSLKAASLTFDTGTVRRVSGEGTVSLTADSVAFRGANAMATAGGTGAGKLDIVARQVAIDGGNALVDGFNSVAMRASDGFTVLEDGAVSIAGDLSLDTPLLTMSAGTNASLDATGAVSILNSSSAGAIPADAGVGARLSVSGSSLQANTTFVLPSGRLELTARDGDIAIGSNARFDLSGRSALFDDVLVATGGGALSLNSSRNVSMASGAVFDVSSGGAKASAGSVTISAGAGTVALNGTLLGKAADLGLGGSFNIDAQSLPGFTALNLALNEGGFDRSRVFRQRGPGTLTFGAGNNTSGPNTIRASNIVIQADRGSIDLGGNLVADAGAAGGPVSIGLFASDNIDVRGSITLNGAEGATSRFDLGTTTGYIALGSSSRVQFTGDAKSDLWIRTSRNNVLSLADADATNDGLRFAGIVRGADRSTVEGVQSYDITASGDPNGVGLGDVAGFITATESLPESLAAKLGGNTRVLAGIDLFSTGDITLSNDLDLMSWRFGADQDLPAVLTLRAAGSLYFMGSLTDAFVGNTLSATNSTWSYRLVGGADLASSNLLSTQSQADLQPGAGNVFVGDNVKVRTGDGFIDMAAANDITLSNTQSVVYTAGLVSPTGVLMRSLGNAANPYPTGGGNLTLTAGRDIVSAGSTQLVPDWLFRAGGPRTGTIDQVGAEATAWTVSFLRFAQNVGALGGGDVTVRAGRDIHDLSVVIPTVGRQVGGIRPEQSVLEVINGGNMSVAAGGNISGGTYYVGRGTARVEAGDSVVAGNNLLGTMLALGDAKIALSARRDIEIGAVLDPMLSPIGRQQFTGPANPVRQSFFATYTADSGVDLASTAGDVMLRIDPARLRDVYNLTNNVSTTGGFGLLPPSLNATAFTGDLKITNSMTLLPAAQGNLNLFAGSDLLIGDPLNGFGIDIIMSDSDPALVPSLQAPVRLNDFVAFVNGIQNVANPSFHARQPVHAGEGLFGGRIEDEPVRLVAREGDIAFDRVEVPGASPQSMLSTPKATHLVAGRDIENANLLGQNLNVGDVTLVSAGRDITYPISRNDLGQIRTSNRELTIGGPGYLQLEAGGEIDLQTSGGISTRGDLNNLGLADTGANVEVTVGLNGKGRNVAGFIDKYLVIDPAHPEKALYTKDLIQFVTQVTGTEPADGASALAVFRQLPKEVQLPLVNRVLVLEIQRVGRREANAGTENFIEAYEALNTLFPGSNPNIDAGETNAYSGDLSLYFSRLYTLDSGNISVFAPGGSVNVGLATPPDSFGIVKPASALGMVVQGDGNISSVSYGDFAVNESRVFSTDGGNILVWSTRGDIDAGRGAKTAISAPAPVVTFDVNGNPQVTISPALAGSGIQAIATTPGRKAGAVDLFAPRGVVNAGDAGIVAGDLTIAATAVLGANNIQVSGTAVGVPVDTSGMNIGLLGASTAAASATNSAVTGLQGEDRPQESAAPLADSAMGWLEVFVEGFGGGDDDKK